MIVAYVLFPDYNDTRMLGNSTYSPPILAGFHDWRYGKEGVPHPATCGTCGRKTDPMFIRPTYRVKRRGRDIGATYDGYDVVSRRFRDFCEERDFPGMEFVPLPADDEFFVLRLSLVLPFDAERRGTRFEKPCPNCGAFYDVLGVTPPFLRGVTEPITDGFYRTDLEFGSGHIQGPLLVTGTETYAELRARKFKKFAADPVET